MKVLVIDDDPSMTELLALLLRPITLEVITANTAPDGIMMAKDEAPDVVVLDLMMPDMDGYQVCSAIRTNSAVPILILSALDMPGMVSKALDAGADDYLIKPVTSGILIAHLNNLVRRANAPIEKSRLAQNR
jgi:DNA-binding response OmpR family regulator